MNRSPPWLERVGYTAYNFILGFGFGTRSAHEGTVGVCQIELGGLLCYGALLGASFSFLFFSYLFLSFLGRDVRLVI